MADPKLYSIGEVAAVVGVSPHTIRAWERRHGIGRPERGRNQQRRYRSDEVELLKEVKRVADLNGMSLRLAFQTVTGSIEPVFAPGRRLGTRRSAELSASAANDSDVWRAVADALPQFIMLLDPEGTVVEANVAVARAYGVVRQRLVGRKFIELVDPFDRTKASILYRPQLRAVVSWELNMATRDGVRLFSFTAQPLNLPDRPLLAVVGSQMFDGDGQTNDIEDADYHPERSVTLSSRAVAGPGALQALQNLLDTMPVGVAVATIGRDPRIVYSNFGLSRLFSSRPGDLLGRRVADLFGNVVVAQGLVEALRARRHRKVPVRLKVPRLLGGLTRYELVIRPMSSSNKKVTSVLLVVSPEPS
jgi:PAS domain S-box-containing protein